LVEVGILTKGGKHMKYLLTGIPTELWIKAKVKCAQEQKSLKQMLLDAIRDYAEPGSPPPDSDSTT